jgi:hypothetical protein
MVNVMPSRLAAKASRPGSADETVKQAALDDVACPALAATISEVSISPPEVSHAALLQTRDAN